MGMLVKETDLWSKWNQEELLKKKASVGSRNFARGWSQVAIADDELIFRPEYIEKCLDNSIGLIFPGEYNVRDLIPRDQPIYMGIDLSISTAAKADYFVIMAVAVEKKINKRKIIGMFRKKGISFNSQLLTIQKWLDFFQPNLTYVETNAYQMALKQELDRTTSHKIEAFTTSAIKKADLEIGLPKLSVEIETGRWAFPYKDEISKQFTDILVNELKSCPVNDHDDTLMAMWFSSVAANDHFRRARVKITVI